MHNYCYNNRDFILFKYTYFNAIVIFPLLCENRQSENDRLKRVTYQYE